MSYTYLGVLLEGFGDICAIMPDPAVKNYDQPAEKDQICCGGSLLDVLAAK